MTKFSASKPSMRDIAQSQDNERNLRRQVAKDHFYGRGNRWHFWGSAVAIALALASPFVLVYRPGWGPALGAIAGVWIFLSRLLFEPLRQHRQLEGAVAQELFDCDVLGLSWNDALVSQMSDEEIRGASKDFNDRKAKEEHGGWYPTEDEMDWPRSVITCQRSNAVWGRRQHHAYGLFLIVAASAWFVAGIMFSSVRGTSLAEYLTTMALPSLPAILDAIEVAKKQLLASDQRRHLETETDAMFDNSAVSHGMLREIQDQVFELRRNAPSVASWFYRILAKSYETDMRYAAKERAERDG